MKSFLFVILFLVSFRSHSSEISVSGISSGAFMASQYYYAYNSQVTGLGLVAGGLYACSGGSPSMALYGCMRTHLIRPSNAQILMTLSHLSTLGLVDSLNSSKGDRLFAISGQFDSTVQKEVIEQAIGLFQLTSGQAESTRFVADLPLGHAFPTLDFGNSCEAASASPYLSRCGVDGAGLILNHLHPVLNPPVNANPDHYYLLSQIADGFSSPEKISLASDAIVYIPKACRGRSDCPIHIAFHGCGQTREQIGDLFVQQSGFSHWAEANEFVILFPQVVPNKDILNPHGCWDWYGYTGPLFHTQKGPQIRSVQKLVQVLQKSRFQLERKLQAP